MNLSLMTTARAFALLAVAITAQLALTGAALAQCQKDGCGGGCCVLECYEKEVEVICWKCECEEFCLPGPCHLGCKNSVNPCNGCKDGGCKGGACQKGGLGLLGGCCGKLFAWRDECPGDCPTHHHNKILYRKIEVVKVPAYRWVIDNGKGGCCKGAILPHEGDYEVPAPPAIHGAQLRYQLQDADGNITQANGMTAQLAQYIVR